MNHLFRQIYPDLPVLVTGHTGFKGSWLTSWLVNMGARVIGFSLPTPPTTPSNFQIAGLHNHIIDVRGDLRDLSAIKQVIKDYRPVIVFHLAAQPIVLQAYEDPQATFDTNAGGTVNLLEAIRTNDSVRATVLITTDKVYENREWVWGYRENDRLGGSDPYSASKAMAEIAIAAYRDSYFPPHRFTEHGVAIASARAGNVIGGGDFGDYRLVPDCLRAFSAEEIIQIRHPQSIRPWQHVLEPTSGYLWLATRLLQGGPEFVGAWNFGPKEQSGVTVQELLEKLINLWGSGRWEQVPQNEQKKETKHLRLSWEKAANLLHWQPVYTWEEALLEAVTWFKAYQQGLDMFPVIQDHIEAYVRQAITKGLAWSQ